MKKNDDVREGKGFGYWDGAKKCMIRCFKCGMENWAPKVSSGNCAWCKFDANKK